MSLLLFKKPEPKMCLQCGEPVKGKGRFCCAECKEEYDLELELLENDDDDIDQ